MDEDPSKRPGFKFLQLLGKLFPISEPPPDSNTPFRTFVYGGKLLLRALAGNIFLSIILIPLFNHLKNFFGESIPVDIQIISLGIFVFTVSDFLEGFSAIFKAINGRVSNDGLPEGSREILFIIVPVIFLALSIFFSLAPLYFMNWWETWNEKRQNIRLLMMGRNYWNKEVRRKPIPWESFKECSLSALDLSGYYFRSTSFSKARLTDIRFDDSCLNHADFSFATLERVSFRGALLENANFFQARLHHVDFTGAWLDPKILQDAAATEGLVLDSLQPATQAYQISRERYPNCR